MNLPASRSDRPRPAAPAAPSLARALSTLLRLQILLLKRRAASGGRPAGSGQGGARSLIGLAVLALVLLWLSARLAGIVSQVVSGPLGRMLLPPLLTALSSAVTVLLFLVAVPTVLGALTFRSDLKLLLLTPVPPWLILAGKLIALFASLVLLPLVIGLPILLAVGQALGLGVGYDVTAVVGLLLLPLLPLSVAMLLTVAVLRWVPPAAARNLTAILGALLAIAYFVGSQTLARSVRGMSAGLQTALAQSTQSWWSSLPMSWPGQALAAAGRGQTGQTLTYLAATLALGLLLAALAVLTSSYLFTTGWATYQEVGRRRRAAAAAPAGEVHGASAVAGAPRPAAALPGAHAPAARATREGTVAPSWRPLIGKEWRSLRRDPQVWARLLYPLFIAGFWFYQALTTHSLFGAGRSNTSPTGAAISLYIALALVGYILVASLALPIVNREGRSLYLLALTPLSARAVLVAKWTFCVLPILIVVEALTIVGAAILHMDLGPAILGVLALGCMIVALAGICILASLVWPRLDWDNPRRQTSGTASLVGSLSALLVGGACCGLLIRTITWPSDQATWAALTGAAIFAMCAVPVGIVYVIGSRRLERLLHGEQ